MTDKDFYSPSEISFKREHIFFIILHLKDMAEGRYPPDFKVTGYTGKKKGGINKKAHFEDPCILAAEVSRRLSFTKTDGKLLIAQVQGGVTEYDDLEWEAKIAINFVSLWDFRKRPKYYVFKKNARYYQSIKSRPYSLKLK